MSANISFSTIILIGFPISTLQPITFAELDQSWMKNRVCEGMWYRRLASG